jgi:hypothetical protein
VSLDGTVAASACNTGILTPLLDPRIHAFAPRAWKDVDGRVKPGHDGEGGIWFHMEQSEAPSAVILGLDPRIHAFACRRRGKTWVAGSSPAMTAWVVRRSRSQRGFGDVVPSLFLTRFPSCAVVRSLACTEGAAVITGLAAQAGRSCGGWGWCPADSGGRSASSPPLGHYEPGAQREPRRRDGAPTRELPDRRPRAGPIAPTRSVWDAGATGRPCPPALSPPDAPASPSPP